MNNRWNRLAPLSGVALVVVVIVTQVLLGSEPGSGASGAQFIDYYTKHRDAIRVSAYLTGLVLVLGVFFYGYLRDHLWRAERSECFGTIAFGGAILFAAGGAIGAGTQLALADVPTTISSSTAQALGLLQQDVTVALIAGGAATLLIASALAVIRGRALPVWIGWLALVLGIASLAPVNNFGALFGSVWTLLVSVVLWRRARQTPVESLTESDEVPSVAG
jgi:hypothetical protein